MAIQLPTNLYSGEAERFNSLPHVQFQSQLMARRKAKDEALDDYYRKLPGTINTAGVRDNERQKIAQGVNDLTKFWIENKAALRNNRVDNGAAALAYEKKFRDLNDLIEESKQRGKTGLELGKLRFQQGNDYIFRDPKIIERIAAHDKTIGEDGSQGLDLATLTMPVKPLESDYIKKNYSDIQFDEGTPIVEKHPTDKYHDVEITPKLLSKEKASAIYQRAATDFENNASFADTISNKLAKDPQNLQALKQLFQSTYGKPLENDHDLAAAFVLQGMDKGDVKQKLIDNGLRAQEQQARSFAHAEKMARIRKADAKELISLRDTLEGQDEENLWVESYINKLIEENKPQSKSKLFGLIPTQDKPIIADPVLYKALNNPDEVKVTRDGNIKLVYFKEIKDEDGNKVKAIDEGRSGVITPEQAKLALGYKATTKKVLGKTMNTGKPVLMGTPTRKTSIKISIPKTSLNNL